MSRYALFMFAFAGFAACNNGGAGSKAVADTANYTYIKWVDSVKDIGSVTAGKKTEISFGFINTGNKPLYIIAAKPGCGCTVADYPKEAIAPGAKGTITANYSAPELGAGDFRKSIDVTTNTKGAAVNKIIFYGTIAKYPAAAKTDSASGKANKAS